MKKTEITSRWDIELNLNNAFGRLKDLFSKGGELIHDTIGLGLIEDKLDVRGINASNIKIVNCKLKGIDFSLSSFSHTWIENTIFVNCRFVKVDFSEFSDQGNVYDSCVFIDCKFNNAGIGYKGSVFTDCVFEKCNYSKTLFIRGEFTRTVFREGKFRNIDFNATFFEDCAFEGELINVWFRGGFPLKSDTDYYGVAKKNEMRNVSFEKAELRDATFSNDCSLSTIKLNSNGKYYKYDNWRRRLEFLAIESCQWADKERTEAKIFTNTHLVHAVCQDWYLLNIDDINRDYGIDIASKIINELNSFN